jgi:hypothetical protein
MNDTFANGAFAQEGREARYGKTGRKHISLTLEAMDEIQAYADRHKLFFSVALESLALIGLGNDKAESLPRMITNLLERVITKQFNRFATILSKIIISAEETNYKTSVLLLQLVRDAAQKDPEHFADNLFVSKNPAIQPDAQIRQMRDTVCNNAHETAVTYLKKSMKGIPSLWEDDNV